VVGAAVPKAAAIPQAGNTGIEQLIRDAAKAAKFGNDEKWGSMAGTGGVSYLNATAGAQSYSASALTVGH
jgi:hypothetical protein